MNTKRLRELATRIETRKVDDPFFSMAHYATFAGSSAPIELEKVGPVTCLDIAGWACYAWKDAVDCTLYRGEAARFDEPFYWAHGRDLLGLTDREADSLFLGQWTSTPMEQITREQAVQRLRGLAFLQEDRAARTKRMQSKNSETTQQEPTSQVA